MTPKDCMNWDPYITYNRDALLRLIAVAFLSIGLVEGSRVETVTRFMRSKVLYTLRPAESALRRLIMLAAEELERNGYVVPERLKRVGRGGPDRPIPKGNGSRVPAFKLIDPRKWFWSLGVKVKPKRTKGNPRISIAGYGRPAPQPEPTPPPHVDDFVDATALCNRLLSIKAALEDIPKQAKRLLLLKARKPRDYARKGPIRPGWPPGWRHDGCSEIDGVLRECHRMAMRVDNPPDTG